MLDLDRIHLGDLAMALEDHSPEHRWWLDPGSGETWLDSEYGIGEGEFEEMLRAGGLDPEELIPIEPAESRAGYADMEDFISRVRDVRARDLLEGAIAGRGAFRRFKDTLLDFPELRDAWFSFHDARIERRAIEWLLAERLIDAAAAEAALEARRDPEPPELSGRFDPDGIARAVAREIGEHYGDRLRQVLLFGSWARGDAHPESDIDLLVVLDQVGSRREERRRMDPILGRHSFENDTVVTALVVSEEELDHPARPVVIRAAAEARAIA